MEARVTKRTFCMEAPTRTAKRPRRSSATSEESVYSLQDRETDIARDTSDTELDSDNGVEYELTHFSPPDRNNPFFSTDDSDELNEINVRFFIHYPKLFYVYVNLEVPIKIL